MPKSGSAAITLRLQGCRVQCRDLPHATAISFPATSNLLPFYFQLGRLTKRGMLPGHITPGVGMFRSVKATHKTINTLAYIHKRLMVMCCPGSGLASHCTGATGWRMTLHLHPRSGVRRSLSLLLLQPSLTMHPSLVHPDPSLIYLNPSLVQSPPIPIPMDRMAGAEKAMHELLSLFEASG